MNISVLDARTKFYGITWTHTHTPLPDDVSLFSLSTKITRIKPSAVTVRAHSIILSLILHDVQQQVYLCAVKYFCN